MAPMGKPGGVLSLRIVLRSARQRFGAKLVKVAPRSLDAPARGVGSTSAVAAASYFAGGAIRKNYHLIRYTMK